MKGCPACLADVPDNAQFCGACGFRLAPIARQRYEQLTELSAAGKGGEACPEGALPSTGSGRPLPAYLSLDPVRSEVADAPTLAFQAPAAPSARDILRRDPRFPLCVEVSANSAHNFIRGTTRDVSVGGLFVATDEPAAVGSELQLRLTLPGLPQAYDVCCLVRWIRTKDAAVVPRVAGMGLQFQNLDSAARAAVLAFVEHREPLPPEP